jgi:peptide/nickel transport system ATP-binding protein
MATANSDQNTDTVLELRNLSKHFKQSSGFVASMKETLLGYGIPSVQAVDEVDMELKSGTVEGIIGESGCGKSTLLRTVMGLYSPTEGDILLDGKPTSEFTNKEWKEYRRRVQIIFQDPFNSMDPKFTVRETLREPLDIHGIDDKEERVHDILEKVELNPPEKYLNRTSNQLSGGEKQRVSIARALLLEPDVVLADEPVSMLDVSTQAAILQLLGELSEDLDVSMLYISHDLSTVSYVCDRVNVMYLGRIVESADTDALLREPKHPYTQALIRAIPIPDPHYDRDRVDLKGTPSDPINLDAGCRFKDRCPERMEICDTAPCSVVPDDTAGDQDRQVACHLYYDHETTATEAAVAEPSDSGSVDGGKVDE